MMADLFSDVLGDDVIVNAGSANRRIVPLVVALLNQELLEQSWLGRGGTLCSDPLAMCAFRVGF